MTPVRRAPGVAQAKSARHLRSRRSSRQLDSRHAATKPVQASNMHRRAARRRRYRLFASLSDCSGAYGPDGRGDRCDTATNTGQFHRRAPYSLCGGGRNHPRADCDVASITAVIVRMVKLLSDLYGIPFERDRARAIVVGLMGGAMPTGLGAVTTSTLFTLFQEAASLASPSRPSRRLPAPAASAEIFVEHFESGSSWGISPRQAH